MLPLGLVPFILSLVPPILWLQVGHPAYKTELYAVETFKGKITMGITPIFQGFGGFLGIVLLYLLFIMRPKGPEEKKKK